MFVACCLLIRGGLLDHAPYGDVHLYRVYGEEMRAGRIPYRDFFDEYPPLAQPVFLFATIASGYAAFFKWTMAICGAAAVALVPAILRSVGVSRRRLVLATAAAAVAPLLVGPIFLNAYDLWPALLLVAGVAALARGRVTTGFVLLGLATAAKAYPVAAAVVAGVWLWRRSGAAAVRRAATAFVAAIVVVTAFFAVTGPGGLGFSTKVQLERGLEQNSLGAALLRAGARLGVDSVAIRPESPGSLNVVGGAARAVGAASSLLELAAIALVLLLVARRRPDLELLLAGVAAAVVAVVAFQKVFSAQYVDWLVAVVPLAGGAAGAVAAALLLAALGLTRIVFDHAGDVWVLLARDLLVVAVYAALVVRLRSRGAAA